MNPPFRFGADGDRSLLVLWGMANAASEGAGTGARRQRKAVLAVLSRDGAPDAAQP